MLLVARRAGLPKGERLLKVNRSGSRPARASRRGIRPEVLPKPCSQMQHRPSISPPGILAHSDTARRAGRSRNPTGSRSYISTFRHLHGSTRKDLNTRRRWNHGSWYDLTAGRTAFKVL